MKTLLSVALLCSALSLATAAAAYENSSVVGQVPDRVVITFQPGFAPSVAKAAGRVAVDDPALDALAARFRVRNMERLYPEAELLESRAKSADALAAARDLYRVWAVDFPAEMGLETVMAAYGALPSVSNVQAVDICKTYGVPNDVSSQQWYLRNLTLGGKDIRAVGGWAEAQGDTNVVVAIVDSGVDWMHPDLGGSGPNYLNGSVKINWTEWYGTTGVDDDGNGKIDDYRGWDFVTGVDGWPDEDNNTPDNDPMDYESHGTACAGCAAAITNNGIGIAGTSWGCKVLPVRVGWLPNGSGQGVVRMDFASQGMVYAAGRGAKIINCSWGSTSYLSMAVSSCVSQGCIIVTAAGNDDDEVASYLNSHPDVISAAATTSNDIKASFSSYGTWVEVCAPGVDIYTTWWNQGTGTHTYSSVQGTSFSSPITCGAVALLWSAFPTNSRTQIMTKLFNSCDDIDALNPGLEGKLGHGRLNLLKALGDDFQEVPEEFPTLLDAMNECAVGDTIGLLGSTTLTGVQTIANKTMNVLGGYAAGFGSRDPVGNPTTINASPTTPALQFQGGTGLGTVVDGFRLTGGGGTYFSGIPNGGRYGGGLIVNQVSPTIRNVDVTGNAVGSTSELGGGGGVLLNNSNATLENVTVHGNSGIYGAGMYIYRGAPTLIGCEIYDNTVLTGNVTYPPLGGGVFIMDADVIMDGGLVTGHIGANKGGGIYIAQDTGTASADLTDVEVGGNDFVTNGGGICLDAGMLSMLRGSVHDNVFAAGATFSYGGGLFVGAGTATVDSVTFTDNAGHVGGGISCLGSVSATVSNSVLAGNTSQYFGGAIAYDAVVGGTVTGNTLVGNTATYSGGGGLYVNNASPEVGDNISAYNTGGTTFANGIHVASGTPTFACNDVYGNDGTAWGGVTDPTGTGGNIAADPVFCGWMTGDYHVDLSSPCAPDNSGGCGLIGAWEAAICLSAVPGDGPDAPPAVFRVRQNYPNPFNPSTVISFDLPSAAHTTVRIYDVSGRLVRTLVDADLAAQRHDLTWTGTDNRGRPVAAGVYFYNVVSGRNEFTGRMALVK